MEDINLDHVVLRDDIVQEMDCNIQALFECTVRTVSLDGDQFLFCIPSENIVDVLVGISMDIPSIKQIKRIATWMEPLFYTYGESWDTKPNATQDHVGLIEYFLNVSADNSAFETPLYGDCELKAGKPVFSENITENNCFRPMLVPLDKDGNWDKSFQQTASNGSIFTGGYLQIVEERKKNKLLTFVLGSSKTTPPPVLEHVTKIDLIPEDGRDLPPLEWISFHGVLICTTNCFITTLKSLYETGMLPILKGAD